MTSLLKGRSRPNASLISMVQRFSDISIMFLGLYLISYFESANFPYFYRMMFLGALVVFQMIGGLTDFYRSWRGVKLSAELSLLVQNWTLSIIFTSGIFSFFETNDVHFITYFKWYVSVSIGLVLCRVFIRFATGFFRRLGFNTRKVAIVGDLPVGINLAKSFSDEPWIGFKIKGVYNYYAMEDRDFLPYAGDLKQLVIDAKQGEIDRIYIAMPMSDTALIKTLIMELTDTTCSVMLIPDIFTFNVLQSRSEEVNGVTVLALFDTPMNGMNAILKRIEDVIFSILILILISPALIIISCFVKVTSPGPIIFRQIRYGMDGKPIKVWKFRSMSVMENGDSVIQAMKGDVRVTKVGAFLRRTSLDELPQFINVLLGDMSIVGPRPHAVAHNELYRTLIKGYMLRHKVKPGITGWAQINGWRGETDTLVKMEKRIEFDLEYIRNWSVWFDLKIIFLTVFKGFIHKAAY